MYRFLSEGAASVQSFWNCLISVGVNDTIGRDEKKYVRFTNVIACLTTIAVACYIPLSIYQGNLLLAGLQFIDVICVLAVLGLNHIGYHKAARFTFMGVINSFVLINACFIGRESGVHEFFYISYMVPFLLFSVKDYRDIAVGVLIAITCFNIYHNIYPLFAAFNLPIAEQQQMYSINVWMKFILFGIAIYILAYYNFSTERALAESNEKLESQATELKRSNEDLEQFAYIISHDLKAPVRNISSFLKLLLTKYGDTTPPDALEFIEFSRTSAERLTRQIDDLLQYCRVGRNLPPTTRLDLNNMVRTIKMELGQKINEADARVTVERELPLLNNIHSSMVHHVFQNLIANGIKFNENMHPEVRISHRIENDTVIFSVADNGIGIEPGFENKLFQMFKRLHTNEKFDGTGIGLAVCKKIVNFYKGEIWYESVADKGTTFYFTLPKSYLGEPKRKPAEMPHMILVTEAA